MPVPVSETETVTSRRSARAADRDLPAGRRVREGVVQQVAQHLADPSRIHVHQGEIGRHIHRQLHACGVSLGREHPDGLFDDGCQGRGLTHEGQLPGLGQRQFLKVAHQALQEHRLFVEVVHQRCVGRQQAVARGFEIAAQVGQRRAQLVCDVADHVAAQLLLLGQAAGHGVESVGEFPDLVLGIDAHPHGQIALFHALGGRREPLDRPQDARGECQGHANGCQDRYQRA